MRLLRVTAFLLAALSAVPALGDARTVQALLEQGLEALRRAERALSSGDPAQARRQARAAEDAFRAARELDRQDPRAARLGTQAAVFANDLKGARAWLKLVRELSPYGERDPDLHYLTALVELRLRNRADLAIRALERMRALFPNVRPVQRDLLLWQSLNMWAARLAETGRAADALKQFKAAIRVAKRLGHPAKIAAARGNVALTLQRDGRLEEAEQLLQALVREAPDNLVWRLYLGMCLGRQHKFQQAVPHYEYVFEHHKVGTTGSMEREFLCARVRLGNCLRFLANTSSGDAARKALYDRAESLFREYIRLKPDEAIGYLWLGTLYFNDLEQPYRALPHFEKAWALDPLCVQPLRYAVQIRSHYPPPPGVTERAWRAPIAGWKIDLTEGTERRRLALLERVRKTGEDGCE